MRTPKKKKLRIKKASEGENISEKGCGKKIVIVVANVDGEDTKKKINKIGNWNENALDGEDITEKEKRCTEKVEI